MAGVDQEQDPLPALRAEEFHPIRQLLMQRRGWSEEEATARLLALIDDENQEPPAPPAPPSPPPPPAPSPSASTRSSLSLQREPRVLPKKKIKFADFDEDAPIPEWIPNSPDIQAIRRVHAMEYVELWFFTAEGIHEANQRSLTTSDNVLSFLKTETGLALQHSKPSKASLKAIVDEDLTWPQVAEAKFNYLKEATKAKWPAKHLTALAEFFINLEELKSRGKSDRLVVRYQAIARRAWHDALRGTQQSFNVGLINPSLIRTLEDKIRDQRDDDLEEKYAELLQQQRLTTQLLLGKDRGRSRPQERELVRHRSSRSKSPSKPSKTPFRKPSPKRSSAPLSACPICLGRHRHPIRKCNASKLWDGAQSARCSRDAQSHIVDSSGRTLCADWNLPVGCDSTTARHVHECSGCGSTSHGAQQCNLAQKAESEHAS